MRPDRSDKIDRTMRRTAKSLILIIDGAPDKVEVLRNALVSADYEVATAFDTQLALQVAQVSQPQLILLDAQMPGIGGYAVCSELKGLESTRHIPVIFVTDEDDVAQEAMGLALGAADYISKPHIRIPVLLARIKAHLVQYGQRRHLEGMFRDVMEFAPDAFILVDVKGKIVQINTQAEQLFGYQREELNGQPVDVLIPQRLRNKDRGYRNRYIRRPHGLMAGVNAQCMRKDGSEFPGDINLSPLETNRGRLVMAVVRDVSSRRLAEIAVEQSRQRLREMTAQNEAAREEERKHIAREVHDELGQVLSALRMDISLLGMRYGTLDQTLVDKLSSMKGLVDRAIQGVRNVTANLRPAALDMGLTPAIEWLCTEFTEHNLVPCRLHTLEDSISLDETRDVLVFRIVQESLTNITRYARASQVDVTLGRNGGHLWVEVRDDGRGFDLAATTQRKSFGLLGMHERALALGGQIHFNSAPGQGTVIHLSIPIDDISDTSRKNP